MSASQGTPNSPNRWRNAWTTEMPRSPSANSAANVTLDPRNAFHNQEEPENQFIAQPLDDGRRRRPSARRAHGGPDRKPGRTDPRLPAHRAARRRRLRRGLEVRGPRRPAQGHQVRLRRPRRAPATTASRAEQELKALSRVKTVRHPFILSLERFDIIDGQLIIVMELADRNLWDRFQECRAAGPARHPARRAARLHGGDGRGARPDERAVSAPAPRHQAAEPVPGPQPRQGRRLRPGQGPGRHAGVRHRRRHAGLRRPRDVRRLGQPLQRPVQPGHRLPGTAHRPAAVHRHQRPPADPAAPPGRPNLAPLPPGDQPVIATALAKNPDDRFPTCRDMVQPAAHSHAPRRGRATSTARSDAVQPCRRRCRCPSRTWGRAGGHAKRGHRQHPPAGTTRTRARPHILRSLEASVLQRTSTRRRSKAPPGDHRRRPLSRRWSSASASRA